MSRVKHLTTLILKMAFLVLVCAATMVMGSMQSASGDEIPLARNFDESNIDVITSNGAALDWEIVDGELVFDVNQSGENYDDILVLLTFDKIGYDSSFIRTLLGDEVGEHEQFISEMENGPWLGHCNFCLKGESLFTVGNRTYTFTDAAMKDYVQTTVSSAANTTSQTDEFTVNKEDDSVMLAITFGAEGQGPVDNGRYTLKADLKLAHPEGKQLDIGFLKQASIFMRFAKQAVSDAGWEMFNITNWLVFYGALIILGWFIYLWRDIRAMAKIFSAILDGDGTMVIVRTYINGVFAEEHTVTNGGNVFVALILTMLCYFVFLVTIPIRILIHIIRDIIYLFKEDDDIEAFSFVGNILGSVGIYALFVGLAGLAGASYAIGVIAAALGVGLCIAARAICKRREEEYG